MVTRGLVTPRVVANGPAGVPRGGTTAKVSFPPGITQFLREVKLPEDKGGSREDPEQVGRGPERWDWWRFRDAEKPGVGEIVSNKPVACVQIG